LDGSASIGIIDGKYVCFNSDLLIAYKLLGEVTNVDFGNFTNQPIKINNFQIYSLNLD